MRSHIYDVTAEDQDFNLIQFEVVMNEFSNKTAFEYAKEYLGYLGKNIDELFVSSCQFCHSEFMDQDAFGERDFFIRPIQGCR